MQTNRLKGQPENYFKNFHKASVVRREAIKVTGAWPVTQNIQISRFN